MMIGAEYEEILLELAEAEQLNYSEEENNMMFSAAGGGIFTLICC